MGKNNQQRRAQPSGDPHRVRPDQPNEPPLAEQVRALVLSGLNAHGYGLTPELNAAIDGLATLIADRGAVREVVGVLWANLEAATTQAWQRGWQPTDVHRLAQRRLGHGGAAIVVDAMASELSTYAAATLDVRWPAQLRAADVHVWWPRHLTYLDARGADVGWPAVIAGALSALQLLGALPEIERLGPLPGTAVVRAHRPSQTPDVEERILERVRALLAKAESTTFEAEAETFTAGAQALMARHSIDAALLAARSDRPDDGPQGRRIGVDNPYESPKASLLSVVADANRCRTVWSRALGFTTVVGHPSDLDAVETLFTSLLVQATRAMTREGSRTNQDGRSRTRAFRSSFLSAFATRVGERLAEVTRRETEAATGDGAGPGNGDLVPLLAARTAAVDQVVESMFPQLVMCQAGRVSDAEGWQSGRRAADRASLGGAAALGRSA